MTEAVTSLSPDDVRQVRTWPWLPRSLVRCQYKHSRAIGFSAGAL